MRTAPERACCKVGPTRALGRKAEQSLLSRRLFVQEGVLLYTLLGSPPELLSPQRPLHKLLRPTVIMKKKDE